MCSRHFVSEDVVEPAAEGGRRRLKPGAVPVLFPWNNFSLGKVRLGVQERISARPERMETDKVAGTLCANDHDYCSRPDPAFVDLVVSENESLRDEVAQLRQQLEQLSLTQRFGLQ